MTHRFQKYLQRMLCMQLCTAGSVHWGFCTNCSPEDIFDRIKFYLGMKIITATAAVHERLHEPIDHPAVAS